MSRFTPPPPLTTGIAVLVGVFTLGLSSWAMAGLARPADYEARVAALQQSIAEIQQGAPGQQIAGFSDRTLCRGALIPAASAVRSDLVRQAGAAGMTLKALESSPGASAGELNAIDVSFTAEGGYEGAVKLVGALEDARPEVFVDSVQMAPQAGRVSLKVKGRAFCWNSAPR